VEVVGAIVLVALAVLAAAALAVNQQQRQLLALQILAVVVVVERIAPGLRRLAVQALSLCVMLIHIRQQHQQRVLLQ
jgi:hypothetical protein